MEKNFRPIYEIAAEIKANWPKMYFGAVPYVEAMQSLKNVNEMYYADSATYILNYFLANAQTWRGEVAKRIKLEIKNMVK